MEQTHGNGVGEAGIDDLRLHDAANNINGGLWNHAFSSFAQAKDLISDAVKSLKLPELQLSNHWHLEKHLDGGVDQISTQAEVNVPAKDFLAQNPSLANKPGAESAKLVDKDLEGAASKSGFNVRHATTGEVDSGWKFESINKDGSVRLSKDYSMQVKATDKHDKLLETLPGVPPEHTKALENKLAQLPANVLQELKDQGYKIIACPTNTDAIPELKGKTPRGWSADSTFDNSDGTHDNVRRVILAPYRFKEGTDFVPVDREDVVVHQIGHALDHALGKLSNSADFQKSFKDDMQKMAEKGGFMTAREKPIYDYFNQKEGPGQNERPGSEEAFASLFGMVLTGPENPDDRVTFEKNFPETIKVVRDQIAKLGAR